ncbi:MAG: hypothetical protein H8D23_17285 [Candidatus Brocadiales bacterium]|nr:hypothetical protein [Candidatus Brocadiales bacterium]
MKYLIILTLLLLNPLAHAEDDEHGWNPFYSANKTIHLKFTDVIDDKYMVNVLWTPDDGLQMALNGPAVVQFVPIKPNNGAQSFVIEYDYFHLPRVALFNLGIIDSDFEYDRAIDLNKTYTLNYGDLIKDPRERISQDAYNLVSAMPFFFEDVNYDGIKELVIVERGAGQRYTDEFYFYKLDGYQYLYKHFDLINTNEADVASNDNVDSLTEFNPTEKTIKVWSQGGACSSSQTTYKQNGELEFHPITHIEWESYANGVRYICAVLSYDISNGEKVLKSKSESYWDSDKSENVELGTKYY